MKQNLEKIFYLHFWLSMKTKEAAGGVPEITATSCVWRIVGKHLPPRQEMWILLPDDPPDRCNVAKRRLCDSQVRSRLLKFKSHFRKKVGSTGSLSGGWTNNFIGCTCNNHSKWLRESRAHTAGERSELSSGEEKTLQLMWTFMSFERRNL